MTKRIALAIGLVALLLWMGTSCSSKESAQHDASDHTVQQCLNN